MFINTFATLTIIFFLSIFLPYATLFGNAADLVNYWNKQENTFLTYFQENCTYDMKEVVNKIKAKKDSFNEHRFSKLKDIDKRINEIKLPFISKIPISANEATIYFPIFIPIFTFIFLLRLFEVFNLRDELIKLDDNDGFGIKSYAKIPLEYIVTLLFIINLIYILCLIQLFSSYYSNHKCNLLQILHQGLDYRQHLNWYNAFYIGSEFLFSINLIIIIIFFRFLLISCIEKIKPPKISGK